MELNDDKLITGKIVKSIKNGYPVIKYVKNLLEVYFTVDCYARLKANSS